MASFSNTRNKIQAILSSFMHEKDEFSKERNERDIAENPGPLSMLCQPRNRENFYDRVETFSPLYLSPQHCALYGWENTDVDLLTCVSCKAVLDGMIGTEWDTDTYNSTCAELRSSIINGHSKFCPWKETPCPESFLSLPLETFEEWKEGFESACRNLLSLEGNLPVLKREAFQELEITEDVLSILSSCITDTDVSSHHQDIIDTVCVLALCGWNTSEKDSSTTLCCSACHREAGLWNFHSLKTVSLINNDCGHQGDAGTVEDARDNDGQHGSHGVMDEDISDDCGRDQQTVVNTSEVGDTLRNEGAQRDNAANEEDMVCDVRIKRHKDSVEQLESDVETTDNDDKQEHTGTQEIECEGRLAGDILVHNLNENNRSTEDNQGTCEMDPAAPFLPKNISEDQNSSQKDRAPDFKRDLEISKISPLHEESSEEKQVQDSSSLENTSKVYTVKTEEQLGETASSEQRTRTEEMDIPEQNTLPQQNSPPPVQNTLTEQNTLPEQDTLPEEISEKVPTSEKVSTPGQEPSPEEMALPEKIPLPEQIPLPEEVQIAEQSSLSEEEPIPEEEPIAEKEPIPEEKLVPEKEPILEQSAQEHDILPQAGTGQQDTSGLHEVGEKNVNQPPACTVSEFTSDSSVETEQGGCSAGASTSGMTIEPSRLFSAGIFSPAHSRQDSLIVEVGEDSMSERMQSIQSDLIDRGETASQLDSCRSLSEWSDGELGEPTSKRLKIDDMEKIEFDVLAEHRNWCPWVTAVPSARNTAENIQKAPGWEILLGHLIKSTSPGRLAGEKHTPPTQVWKSVRRLFHDCQNTIMRSSKSHVVEGKV